MVLKGCVRSVQSVHGGRVGDVPQHIASHSMRPAAQSIVASPPFSQSSAFWHVYSVPSSSTPAVVLVLKGCVRSVQSVHGADALPLLATQRMRSESSRLSSSPAGFHNTVPPNAQSCALHLASPSGFPSPAWNPLPPRPSASAAARHSASVAAMAKPVGQEMEANWYVWGGGGGDGGGSSSVGAVPQHFPSHSMRPAAQSIVASPPFSQSSVSWHVYLPNSQRGGSEKIGVMALKGCARSVQSVHGADALPLLATQRMRFESSRLSSSPAGFHNTVPPNAQS